MISAAAALVCAVVLAGCSAKLPEGYDKFTAAREKYEKLDSAAVTMTDLSSGEEIMEFRFCFNGNDEMVFSYYGMNVAGLQIPVWWFPTLVSLILALVALVILMKFKMFK